MKKLGTKWRSFLANDRQQTEWLERLLQFARGQYDGSLLMDFAFDAVGREPLTIGNLRESKPSETTTADAREWLLQGFQTLAEKHFWRVDSADIGPYAVYVRDDGRNVYSDPGGRAVWKLGFLQLLDSQRGRIRRCAWCGTAFVRKKQANYCNTRCSQARRTFRSRRQNWKSIEVEAEKAGLPIREFMSRTRTQAESGSHAQNT